MARLTGHHKLEALGASAGPFQCTWEGGSTGSHALLLQSQHTLGMQPVSTKLLISMSGEVVPEQCASHARIALRLPPLLSARHPASSHEHWVPFCSMDESKWKSCSAAQQEAWSPAVCRPSEAGDCIVSHTELAACFTVEFRAEAGSGTSSSSSSSALSITAVGSTCNRRVLITEGHRRAQIL